MFIDSIRNRCDSECRHVSDENPDFPPFVAWSIKPYTKGEDEEDACFLEIPEKFDHVPMCSEYDESLHGDASFEPFVRIREDFEIDLAKPILFQVKAHSHVKARYDPDPRVRGSPSFRTDGRKRGEGRSQEERPDSPQVGHVFESDRITSDGAWVYDPTANAWLPHRALNEVTDDVSKRNALLSEPVDYKHPRPWRCCGCMQPSPSGARGSFTGAPLLESASSGPHHVNMCVEPANRFSFFRRATSTAISVLTLSIFRLADPCERACKKYGLKSSWKTTERTQACDIWAKTDRPDCFEYFRGFVHAHVTGRTHEDPRPPEYDDPASFCRRRFELAEYKLAKHPSKLLRAVLKICLRAAEEVDAKMAMSDRRHEDVGANAKTGESRDLEKPQYPRREFCESFDAQVAKWIQRNYHAPWLLKVKLALQYEGMCEAYLQVRQEASSMKRILADLEAMDLDMPLSERIKIVQLRGDVSRRARNVLNMLELLQISGSPPNEVTRAAREVLFGGVKEDRVIEHVARRRWETIEWALNSMGFVKDTWTDEMVELDTQWATGFKDFTEDERDYIRRRVQHIRDAQHEGEQQESERERVNTGKDEHSAKAFAPPFFENIVTDASPHSLGEPARGDYDALRASIPEPPLAFQRKTQHFPMHRPSISLQRSLGAKTEARNIAHAQVAESRIVPAGHPLSKLPSSKSTHDYRQHDHSTAHVAGSHFRPHAQRVPGAVIPNTTSSQRVRVLSSSNVSGEDGILWDLSSPNFLTLTTKETYTLTAAQGNYKLKTKSSGSTSGGIVVESCVQTEEKDVLVSGRLLDVESATVLESAPFTIRFTESSSSFPSFFYALDVDVSVNSNVTLHTPSATANFAASAPSSSRRPTATSDTTTVSDANNATLPSLLDLDAHSLALRWTSDDSEAFFGFGEQYTYVNLKGKRVPIFVSEQGVGRGLEPLSLAIGLAAGNAFTTYAPMPLYLAKSRLRTRDAYGFVLHTSEYAVFDMTDPDTASLSVLFVEEKEESSSTSSFAHISFSLLRATVADPDEDSDHANDVKRLLRGITTYTGRQPPLPEWIMKNGAILAVEGSSELVLDKVRVARNASVPVSAVWVQDWSGVRVDDFGVRVEWNWRQDPTRYANWSGLVDTLGRELGGVRMLTYINPYLANNLEEEEEEASLANSTALSSSPSAKRKNLFREAESLGHLVRNKKNETYLLNSGSETFTFGSIDLTKPSAREWYASTVIRCGMLGVKEDCDPDDLDAA
eukprot:g3041.t1